jgi:hypothetical protein
MNLTSSSMDGYLTGFKNARVVIISMAKEYSVR